MTDEELIAELRRIGPLLLRRDGDDVARYGGGLLNRAADRLEGRYGDLPDKEENDG